MSVIRKTSSTGSCSYIETDEQSGTVIAQRDFPGIFPVYYVVTNEGCFCDFRIEDVIKKSGISRQNDPDALGLYLTFSCLPGQRTFYKDVKKLMPGCRLEYKDHKLSITRYYHLDTTKKSTINVQQATADIRSALESSVQSCHEDAAFLSSGIDSSILSKLGNVSDTYTVDYDEEGFSEADEAEAYSKEIGAKHHRLKVNRNDYFSVLPECASHIEQPVGDCSYPTYYLLCKMAAQERPSAFSGEGSDELFFGYPLNNYLRFRWYEKLPKKFRQKMLSVFGSLHPTLERFLRFHNGDILDGYRGPVVIFTDKEKEELLVTRPQDDTLRELLDELYDGISDLPLEERMYYFNIREWMEADILTGAVKLADGAGLSVTMPFLNKNVIQTANSIPVKYQIHSGETKHLLRKAFEGVLPDRIVHGKKKGFAVPISAWMRDPAVFDHICSILNSPKTDRYFCRSAVTKLLEKYASTPEDNWTWRKIWLLYSYMIWTD